MGDIWGGGVLLEVVLVPLVPRDPDPEPSRAASRDNFEYLPTPAMPDAEEVLELALTALDPPT